MGGEEGGGEGGKGGREGGGGEWIKCKVALKNSNMAKSGELCS